MYKALLAAYANHGWDGTTEGSGIPSLHEFGAAVESVESGAKGRNARDRLRPFTDFGLFQDDAEGQFEILSNSGGLVARCGGGTLNSQSLSSPEKPKEHAALSVCF